MSQSKLFQKYQEERAREAKLINLLTLIDYELTEQRLVTVFGKLFVDKGIYSDKRCLYFLFRGLHLSPIYLRGKSWKEKAKLIIKLYNEEFIISYPILNRVEDQLIETY